MLLVLLLWLAYLVLFFQVITHRIQIAGFVPSLVIMVVLFFVLCIWSYKHLTRPKGSKRQQPSTPAAPTAPAASEKPAAPAAPAATDPGVITFRVAGVTFKNDDGKSRQDILRHMKFGDPPWADDPDDLVGELVETTFDGEPAIEVYVNGHLVGHVPKAQIASVSAALKNVATCHVSDVQIIGGGTDQNGTRLSYGCMITLKY